MDRIKSALFILVISITCSYSFSITKNKAKFRKNLAVYNKKFEEYLKNKSNEEKFYLYGIAGKTLFYNDFKKSALEMIEKAIVIKEERDISQHLALALSISFDLKNMKKWHKYKKMAKDYAKVNRYLSSKIKMQEKGIQAFKYELDKVPVGLRNEVYRSYFQFLASQGEMEEAIRFAKKYKFVFSGDYNSMFERDIINLLKNKKSRAKCLNSLEKRKDEYSYGVLGCDIISIWKKSGDVTEGMERLVKYFNHFDFQKKYILNILSYITAKKKN